MTPLLIASLITGVIQLLAEVAKLLQAKTDEERDEILVAARARRQALTVELDDLADAAQARIDARS